MAPRNREGLWSIVTAVAFAAVLIVGLPAAAFSQTGSISASPNPCQIASGQTTCTSTLTWSTQSTTQAQVWVSVNGAAETNFASGTSGSQPATWIQGPPNSYLFRLYAYSGGVRGALLASVTVTATPPPTGSVSGSPNPCQINQGQTTCTSTLTWSTQNTPQAQVWVSANGAAETNFASGTSGSQPATWIQGPPNSYLFRLYAYSGGVRGAQLAQVTVTGILPTVTISATDASASEPGSNTGTFTVSRTGSTTTSLTVSYTTGGTATSGSDYTALSGSVTIPIGAASAPITLTPLDDVAVESSETVIVTLSNNVAYNVGSPSNATVTILDNDSGLFLSKEYIYVGGKLVAVE